MGSKMQLRLNYIIENHDSSRISKDFFEWTVQFEMACKLQNWKAREGVILKLLL